MLVIALFVSNCYRLGVRGIVSVVCSTTLLKGIKLPDPLRGLAVYFLDGGKPGKG